MVGISIKIKRKRTWFGLGDEVVLKVELKGTLLDVESKMDNLEHFLVSSKFWVGGES